MNLQNQRDMITNTIPNINPIDPTQPSVDYSKFKNEGDLIRNGEEWLQLLHKEPNQTNSENFYFIARDNDSTDKLDIYVVESNGDNYKEPITLEQYQQTMPIPPQVWDEWVNDFLPGAIEARRFHVDIDEVLPQPRQILFNPDTTWKPVDDVPEKTLALFDQTNIVHATYYTHVDFDALLKHINANDEFTEILSSLGADNDEAKQNLLHALNPDTLKTNPNDPTLTGSITASKRVYTAGHPTQGASASSTHNVPSTTMMVPPPQQPQQQRTL